MSTKTLGLKALAMITALLFHPSSQADLYKWVDANGKTHYSNNKDAAGKAQVKALPTEAAPAVPPKTAATWQEREREFKWRQQRSERQQHAAPAAPRRLSTTYGSDAIDTDKAKCELARDVTSGAVRHVNGAVTDANDRQIAKRDIETFCR